jgi:hypothetical protein
MRTARYRYGWEGEAIRRSHNRLNSEAEPFTVGVLTLLQTCAFAGAIACATSASAQTDTSENLLCEGSFEHTGLALTCWQVDRVFGGSVNSDYCGDGRTCIRILGGGSLWQTFATQPGEEYAVRFIFGGGPLRVSLDSTQIGIAVTNAGGIHWQTFTGLATSASTSLKFTALSNDVPLDGVKVFWTREPPSILLQPRSASTYVGGTVSFDVRVKGTSPMA